MATHDGSAEDGGVVAADVFAVNVVDADAEAELHAFLLSDGATLEVSARAFFAAHPGDYDFLYLLTDRDLGGDVSGRFHPVSHPAEACLGLPSALDQTAAFGSDGRLQGVIALNLNDVGNGPTLHETLHRWGVFVDEAFGLGCDAETCFGPHWGLLGHVGQLGGFDADSLRCAGTSQSPPCAVDGTGRQHVTVAPFGPTTNGGDSVPYSLLELYLMGLVALEDVPFPLTYLNAATFMSTNDNDLHFLVEGYRQITRSDWRMTQGECALRPVGERAFRAAFVVVSSAAAPSDVMDAAHRWARIFAGVEDDSRLLSFAEATGGRASMDARVR